MMKKFEFINQRSLKEFKSLPSKVQLRFANDLNAIGCGKAPFSPYKHLAKSVGKGAIELIENGSPAYRAIYVSKYQETIFILHSFTKTTNGVDRKAMNTAKKRYQLMQDYISSHK